MKIKLYISATVLLLAIIGFFSMKFFLDPAQKQFLIKYLTPYNFIEKQEKKITQLEDENKQFLSLLNFSEIELTLYKYSDHLKRRI